MIRMLFLLATISCMQRSYAATVDTVSIYSEVMKRNIKAVVIEPSGGKGGEAYPVLYLLHGLGGNYSLWINKVPYLQQAADKYKCVIVCPDGGRATVYFDNPMDSSSRFESHFVQELMPYIEQHYPVSLDRRYRAITGISMGGFGAMLIASRHNDLFSVAGSMSGVLNLRPFTTGSALRQKIADSTCCSIDWEKLKNTRLIIDCGLQDYLLPVNRNIHKQLETKQIAHDYIEREGRHDWYYWKVAIDFQLFFIRKAWDEGLSN
ncbi:hypothetical protein OI18_16485 [Flavihumibacter solisilvae]|uniref:XynC protein n=2 Tax=Flavihumibacter solisilvae TaxID=1349421 RepID=A0A0C1IGQ7_9BACT|nr:hypothetical protein OI18_16485 [Flavihumibacter solisilvae]